MINLKRIKNKKIKNLFFKSFLGNINIIYINTIFIIPKQIKIYIKENKIIFEKNDEKNVLTFSKYICFLKKKNKLLITSYLQDNILLNLYNNLLKLKFKGFFNKFKETVFIQGIGFKVCLKKNILCFKIGFSHSVCIEIPLKIKVQLQSNKNSLIFTSIDYIFLKQFIFFIKNCKKPEPYKGKGFLLRKEKIKLKEGKKKSK